MIEAVIFDYGGVFSSPLFRGIGDFESRMGYPPGSVLELLFGDKAYVGVEGAIHAVEREVPTESVTHDWHRLEVGELSLEEWFAGVAARAPAVLGQDIDMGAYLQFMADMPVGVHWPVVHRARELKAAGMPIALLTSTSPSGATIGARPFPSTNCSRSSSTHRTCGCGNRIRTSTG